jgi:hypothetical protein
MFLARRCVQSSFTAADEKLVLSLHRRGIPLVQVERAILLGTARKYVSLLQHGRGTPISSLHYFTAQFEAVHQEVSPQYWAYVARKVKAFEQTRAGFVTKATDMNEDVANGHNGGCYDSTDMPVVAPNAS